MKTGFKRILWAASLIGAIYGMVYVDVVLRARDAYQEGEKYWRWAEHPEVYRQWLDQKLAADKGALEAQRAGGHLSVEELDRRLDLLQFGYEQSLRDSNMKYAYYWYQTAVDLFSPPDSKWVKRAREKMPLAKERWKAELREKKIPFDESMID